MLEIRNAPLSRRILTCAVLLGIAAPGAPALAQRTMTPWRRCARTRRRSRARRSIRSASRLEGQLATIDRGAGTGDPAKDEQIRRYQEAAGQAAGRTRSRHAAGQAHGLRKLGLLLAVQRPVRRSAVRSTTRSSRCAPISTRSPPAWSGCAAAASAAPTAKTSAARC